MPRLVVTCLWAGNDLPDYSANRYGIEDVLTLWRGVRRFVKDGELLVLCDQHYFDLLTDTDKVFPLMRDGESEWDVARTCKVRKMLGECVGGWSNVMEAFHPSLKLFQDQHERVLLVGLDTVFVADSTWLFEDYRDDPTPILLPPDPHSLDNPPCDAVVLFNSSGGRIAWGEYVYSKQMPQFPHLYGGRPSEMVLLQHLFKNNPTWNMLEATPRRLLSYKAHVRAKHLKEIPLECSIVYFHGNPKPRDLSPNDIVARIAFA